MSISSRLVGALIVTTALTLPSLASAQESPVPGTSTTDESDPVDVSVPGGSSVIVVTGRVNRDPAQTSAQVTSVLSTEDIARTGEGDIAGALSRVTGLSVVGNGFVYVRGLGDRYSLALLNGSPLPSPEPLKRVVPLDLFPTSVVSSSLVQKSYSVNFPGEFGGGVINLTTRTTPDEPFLTIGGSIGGDVETTFQNGLSYYGSSRDWLGYDNGARQPGGNALQYVSTPATLPVGAETTPIAAQLVTSQQAVIQQIGDVQPNLGLSLSGGTAIQMPDGQLGIVAAASYSNNWSTRDTIQQSASSGSLNSIENDFRQVATNQNVLVNGMLGFGLELGEHVIRWTNVYIHDTLKRASLSEGTKPAQNGDTRFVNQRTGFYARQLIDTQLVGEFKFGDLSLDLRGSYANTKRDAPGELMFPYRETLLQGETIYTMFSNSGDRPSYTYSKLNEDLYSAGLDLTYPITDTFNLTVGGAWSDSKRFSLRREFLFSIPATGTITKDGVTVSNPDFAFALATLRPDLYFSPEMVNALGITLIDSDPGTNAFNAGLENWAGYAKADLLLNDMITIDAGVRYEKADLSVSPAVANSTVDPTNLSNDYFLPALTVTFDLDDGMQIRLNGSKTIARPQFRELIAQPFYDPDSNRAFRGNPYLQDSELYNAEARFEWYFARGQRISLAGFYKKIDKPIETFVVGSTDLLTSFANAPEASLYGAEFDVTKYFDLESMGGLFSSRQAVVLANYTYTKSELKVSDDDLVNVFGALGSPASIYFRDGAPLTGQSDHLVNLQFGLEDLDRLSQQTILVSYASNRVVSRGLVGQPDIVEKPGVRIDFVWREGFRIGGTDAELKLEARNLLGTRHQEFQDNGTDYINVNTYDVGQSFSAGLSVTF
ncbi:TonB-dependent receptor [Aurantiacibacter xanthus]|uniref:TonB-dependent receptor n=1 Tax=Aurantiacibacter xanthus TaxID=1784712 RepID=A0A3A1P4R5_9SPHN|nr:TonB-dependent receptor [Aurantiacibacter xanthus]RIV88147.1 TonB-dependent receptor [Aurantiacibacter xanthus]